MSLLEVREITAGYGRVEVLHSLSLEVDEGEVLAVLGPNGVGKTTLLSAVSGTLSISSGRILLDGRRIDGRTPYEIARAGVLLVPEGRGVFPGLTVAEHLAIGSRADRRAGPQERARRIEEVLARFPRLAERLDQRAGTMSGGEQQMLALSRAFLSRPRILLLDEISMGLAPIIVEQLFESIATLRDAGQSIVLVEQYLTFALEHADRVCVLHKGEVTLTGSSTDSQVVESLSSAYLGT